ncbi:hypothetical protein E4U41_005268, partial [Claviceps citrina]
WNTLYTRELENHASDPTDTGTVWFDDSDAEARMMDLLDRHYHLLRLPAEQEQEQEQEHEHEQEDRDRDRDQSCSSSPPKSPPPDRRDVSLLDLGCGNGSMLFALRERGWSGRALGVDYSPQSVQLARQ